MIESAPHHVDFGGPADAPTALLVHGLGGSHLNWDLLAPLLAQRMRVLAVDLPGFGMSAPTGRPATIRSHVRTVARFLDDRVGEPVVLVGNSMGGMVSLLLSAQHPELVRALVLLDPAVPVTAGAVRNPVDARTIAMHALPGVGERLRRRRRLRIGAHETLRETWARVGVDGTTMPPDLVDRTVALVARQSEVGGMDRAFLSASRSLAWTLVRRRTYQARMAGVRAPVLLVHGDQDLLVPVAAARAAAARHPEWRYVEMAGVGHLPQLQAPDDVAALVFAFLDDHAVAA